MPGNDSGGPVLFAFDGSDHARAAIEVAGRELRTGRRAIVLTVWEPLESIPFWGVPMGVVTSDATDAVVERARKVAAEGVELAAAAGFDAEPLVREGTPVWAGIVRAADDQDAAIIVMGSHGRGGVAYAVMGSVATAVAHHSERPVMVARPTT